MEIVTAKKKFQAVIPRSMFARSCKSMWATFSRRALMTGRSPPKSLADRIWRKDSKTCGRAEPMGLMLMPALPLLRSTRVPNAMLRDPNNEATLYGVFRRAGGPPPKALNAGMVMAGM